MKPASTVIGPDEEIIYPDYFVNRLDYEAELAVVMKQVKKMQVKKMPWNTFWVIPGGNDVTARNLQSKDGQMDSFQVF